MSFFLYISVFHSLAASINLILLPVPFLTSISVPIRILWSSYICLMSVTLLIQLWLSSDSSTQTVISQTCASKSVFPWGQICFCQTGHSLLLLLYILSKASSLLQLQAQVGSTETIQPAKSEILSVWLKRKACQVQTCIADQIRPLPGLSLWPPRVKAEKSNDVGTLGGGTGDALQFA